jgi:CelD/BcsL family acetyltransferase involved in cellulose biosynthesis
MALTADLLDDVDALAPHRAAWDALAVGLGRPYCTPAWMLAWWHEAAPAGGRLAVIAIRDGDELAAIAPFWANPDSGRYGMLAERTASPVEPLVRPGLEREAAVMCADVLADASARPTEIVFQNAPARSNWPRLLLAALEANSAGALRVTRVHRLPRVTLVHDSLDAWLAARSRNFRQQVRRTRRRLADEDARFRLARIGDLDGDLASLARLHHARWAPRGGSRAMDERIEAMLRRAGRELIAEGRFRLWSLDAGGATISTHLFVAGGDRQAYWLGGFDDAWAEHRPAIQVLVEAVADGIERGERLVELGPGALPYKYRLADSEELVASVELSLARA